tara:strand:- start:128 stop:331 length:204 start_codon:yes stop_codon:yes gene_type:complete
MVKVVNMLLATVLLALACTTFVAAFSDPNEDKPAGANLPKDAKVGLPLLPLPLFGCCVALQTRPCFP